MALAPLTVTVGLSPSFGVSKIVPVASLVSTAALSALSITKLRRSSASYTASSLIITVISGAAVPPAGTFTSSVVSPSKMAWIAPLPVTVTTLPAASV